MARLSIATEDYLKAVWALSAHGRVTTTALASELGVSAASATAMLKKLARLGLVDHAPYHGVALTAAGERVAVEVVRHHRLIESFLVEALGVPWDEVHEEAEHWEHVLSEQLERRMDEALGHPTTDPHGAPIPAQDGEVAERASVRLAELEAGQRAIVAEVSDDDPELLRYLGGFGLYPGTEIEVVDAAPFEGPLTFRAAGGSHAVGREAARHVRVREVRAA
ncbi:MAG: metal-dependent transcriptional regulator [Thermoleophilia bacterium]|nr:metal-dependent transcriptional regulator [Thermoleophilia bacterium]